MDGAEDDVALGFARIDGVDEDAFPCLTKFVRVRRNILSGDMLIHQIHPRDFRVFKKKTHSTRGQLNQFLNSNDVHMRVLYFFWKQPGIKGLIDGTFSIHIPRP
jgi:hypothetical protein